MGTLIVTIDMNWALCFIFCFFVPSHHFPFSPLFIFFFEGSSIPSLLLLYDPGIWTNRIKLYVFSPPDVLFDRSIFALKAELLFSNRFSRNLEIDFRSISGEDWKPYSRA